MLNTLLFTLHPNLPFDKEGSTGGVLRFSLQGSTSGSGKGYTEGRIQVLLGGLSTLVFTAAAEAYISAIGGI